MKYCLERSVKRPDMPTIRCVVERITYRNEENGYSVLKTRVKGYTDLVAVVGNLADVNIGSVLTVNGDWKLDGKYGRQFVAEKWEETLPATVYGIEKYLGSGLIKGIGPKYAKKIVAQFGENTLEIIERDSGRLIEVPGIGGQRVAMIRAGWEKQKEIKNVMLFLQAHDVSTAHAAKIYKAYGNESIETVTENPYRLADDIWGIGFRTADIIASKLGVSTESYARCRSGLLYTLNRLADEGHCYALREQLLTKGEELLSVESYILSMTLDEMIRVKDVIIEKGVVPLEKDDSKLGDAIYLPPFYSAELGIAKRLAVLLKTERTKSVTDVEEKIKSSEHTLKIQYDEIQLEAIQCAVNSKVMVLTGGPGTGKTTITSSIIRIFRSCGFSILLAAPTGRAAKRMTEATGMEAKTIHRLLEYKPQEGYQYNEENLLQGDVLIVDECSMIDTVLMYNLLKALPDAMTVVLVGDIDQLPSIGAGNVLRDVIASERIPVIQLTHIFRQAQGSRIITNAHRINHGEFPDIRNQKESDFFFIDDEEPKHVAGQIIDLCKTRLPKRYHLNAISDIQVLTPMQRGVIGAVALNAQLQDALNPCTVFLRHGGTEYRLHDKVMQIRNDYDKEVFNGDIGVINHLNLEDRELTVSFDGRSVPYDVTELDELVLAYATTIHKAQGSEYPVVVMPILMTHFVMLQRNLIYTGITRAKKLLVIVGSKKALGYAVRNHTVLQRNTRLAERIQRLVLY